MRSHRLLCSTAAAYCHLSAAACGMVRRPHAARAAAANKRTNEHRHMHALHSEHCTVHSLRARYLLRREMLLSRLQATLGSFLLAARHSGQPAATHYNTLQHTTTRCNTLRHIDKALQHAVQQPTPGSSQSAFRRRTTPEWRAEPTALVGPGAGVVRGEPSPGADVVRGEPSPGADVVRGEPRLSRLCTIGQDAKPRRAGPRRRLRFRHCSAACVQSAGA